MKVVIFQFSLFGINTYLVYDEKSGECVVIDPGMISEEEEKAIERFITEKNLSLKYVIYTHLHLDHAVGNDYLKKTYNVPVLVHPSEEIYGKNINSQAQMFGINRNFKNVEIDQPVYPGEIIKIGSGELEAIDVAGHSPGGLAFYDKKDGFIIVGDALFQNSIGRTDLHGGDLNKLLNNIKKNLFSLPDDTIVYPGHGDPTTIGDEKSNNPFLKH